MLEGSTIITINSQGIVLSVDKNACKLFGYTLDELIGHKINRIIPAPYKEQHDSYLDNYQRTGVPKIIGKNRMVEGQHKDGSIFPIRLSVSKVGEGADVVFIGMVDRLEDKSVSITINSNGIIVSCNQVVEEMFGFKPGELLGNNVNMLMPSPHKERHGTYLQSYSKGGEAKVIGKVRNVPAKHKNGTVFPVSLQVEPVKMGNIELFRGKIEKVDTMEAVFSIDDSGLIVSCNHNFVLPLFGYTSNELVGQNISQLIPEIHQSTQDTIVAMDEKAEPTLKKHKTTNSQGSSSSSSDPLMSTNGSWKTAGISRKELRHKDGSIFPVNLEICPFQTSEGKSLYSGRIKRADMNFSDYNSEDSSQKFIGEYCVVRTIGQGTYGKVKLAFNKNTKTEVAIKILSKSKMKENDLERAHREVEIMQKLKHPNICKLYDVVETEDALNIVMEYAGGTLLAYVMERGGLSETDAYRFFKQITSAIEYCHRLNIVHRDIKHQNILLGENEEVKIIDFGLSNFMEEGHLRSTFCGTPAYACPEMILGKKYLGPEVDIWSMGVVLYSMITGQFPFENVADIISGTFKDPKNVSQECTGLLRKMFQVDAKMRCSLDQLLDDPWMMNGPGLANVKTIECTVLSSDPASNPSSVESEKEKSCDLKRKLPPPQ